MVEEEKVKQDSPLQLLEVDMDKVTLPRAEGANQDALSDMTL